MIPNVRRGSNIVGLASYLAGPGRSDEHEHPHLVAGSAQLMAWYSDVELSHEDALDIGRELDQTKRAFGVDVTGGHVWHCSLSLPTADGVLSDEQWEQIATDFMHGMGYVGDEAKADVPWAVFRHGLSGTTGNDHVHIAASLVREDGTKASTWYDMNKAQTVSRELEKKYGLTQIMPGHGSPGVTPQELHASEKRGRTEAERTTLGRMLRGYAVASKTEAEFVRRARRGGLIMKPRFGSGGVEEVTGYAAALKPPKGMQPMYYAGGKIARDLGLRVLRQGWTESGESKTDALNEWTAAKFGKRIVNAHGRDSLDVSGDVPEVALEELKQLRERLRDIPFDDREQWRHVAHWASGVYASWSQQTEPEPGPLAAISDELARSAQVSRSAYKSKRPPGALGLASATAFAFAAHRGGPAAALAVFMQMQHITRAVLDFNQARGDEIRQTAIARSAHNELAEVKRLLKRASRAEDELSPSEIASFGLAPMGASDRPVTGPDLAARRGAGAVSEKSDELSR